MTVHFRTNRSRAAGSAALLALLLAACGGGDTPAPDAAGADPVPDQAAPAAEVDAPPSSVPVLRGDTVEVMADEYVFGFASLELPEGDVVFEVRNVGHEYHNLVILQGDSIVFFPDQDVVPAQTATFATTLAPGEYYVVCTIAGHEDRGMHEVLTITPANE